MSLGKKKSGFRITSVTSDYEKKGALLQGGGGQEERAPEEAHLVENGHLSQPPKRGPTPQNGPLPHLPSFAGVGSGGPGSRFRVVKLDHGLGEPYRRGRWTCRDFYEQEIGQHRLAKRHHLAEATRQPQSLDSRLEVAGLLSPPLPSSSSSAFGPPGQRRAGIGLQSLLVLPGSGPSAYQARSLGEGLPVLRPGGTPPSLAPLRGARGVAETPPAPEEGPPKARETVPGPRVDEQMLPKSVVQLIPRETEERHKILPRETRSRPSSPAAPLLFREAASPHRRTSDPFGVAPRFNLARSVFGMGASHDSDDDSGTNSSLIAIDNKIEQAMDLVKSHLMFAVREEVEVLREQIKELSERNAALEQENSLLRSLAGAEPGVPFQAQRHESKPPSGGSA